LLNCGEPDKLADIFSLFIEDIELFLQQDYLFALTIHEICILTILFADDMVICGDTVEDLQASLNFVANEEMLE
jgi:hypothetical protein